MTERGEERQWMRDLRAGRREVLMAMYDRYKHDMLALGVSLARNREVAEDAVHDVFVNLARRGPQLRIRGNLKPYLLTSVANRVRNLARGPVFSPLPDDGPPDDVSSDDPSGGLMADEITDLVQRALEALPVEQRDVVALHLEHNLRFREIARALGISVNTAKSRYRYGLAKLRQLLNGTAL